MINIKMKQGWKSNSYPPYWMTKNILVYNFDKYDVVHNNYYKCDIVLNTYFRGHKIKKRKNNYRIDSYLIGAWKLKNLKS